MDRKYKAFDEVNVYEKLADRKNGVGCITTFKDQPYSYQGCDNYRYEDVMYMGFYDPQTGEVYIALDQPLPMMGGKKS